VALLELTHDVSTLATKRSKIDLNMIAMVVLVEQPGVKSTLSQD